MEVEESNKKLYLPANVALWLLIESGASDNDPDVEYLKTLGDELVLIEEPVQ
jgi:uncharacterized membrane-anchored protein